MYKLLIVDDDMLARLGMRTLIDWGAYGYRVMGTADGGEQALELMKNDCPDVVFTDVVMHGMDGVELTRRIKEAYPDVLVVALSCYTDVDYVKNIIRMGAEDYLQKLSMRPEDVIRLLRELTVKLDAKRGAGVGEGEKRLSEALRQVLLDKGEGALAFLGTLPAPFGGTFRMLALRRTQGVAGFSDALMDAAAASLRAELGEGCLRALYREDVTAFLLSDRPESALVTRCDALLRRAVGQDRGALSVGVSRAFDNPEELYHHFCKAGEAGMSAFVHPDRRVFVYQREDKAAIDAVYQKSEELLRLLDAFDLAEVLRQTPELTRLMRALETQPVLCRQIYTSLFARLMRVAVACGAETDARGFNAVSLDAFAELAQAERAFLAQVQSAAALVARAPSRYRPEIRQAIAYIEAHFAEEVTLPIVAAHVAMSESHLSSLFKRETGKGLINYLEETRIAQATRLMSERREPLYSVAQRVGYNNVNYFSRVFKKVRGVSPRQFIERQKF